MSERIRGALRNALYKSTYTLLLYYYYIFVFFYYSECIELFLDCKVQRKLTV